jgi:hypothetical protein
VATSQSYSEIYSQVRLGQVNYCVPPYNIWVSITLGYGLKGNLVLKKDFTMGWVRFSERDNNIKEID